MVIIHKNAVRVSTDNAIYMVFLSLYSVYIIYKVYDWKSEIQSDIEMHNSLKLCNKQPD